MKIAVALIPLLPLVGFVVTLLFGKRFGAKAHLLPVAMVTASAALCIYAFVWVVRASGGAFVWNAFTWITAGRFERRPGASRSTPSPASCCWWSASSACSCTTTRSATCTATSGYYRFFAYLNLFMFAMFMLVLADNYLLMFLGWEGVGLCSYLLIAFWFRKKSASQAGKKAFLVNRVGDFGFTLGMLLIFVTIGTLQFTGVFEKGRDDRRRHPDLDLPAALHRRRGQERPVPAARLAAGRHGGPHAGQRPHPRRDHGQRRRVHGGALVPAVHPLGHGDARGDGHRHVHGHLRGVHRDHPERHQEGDRLLHRSRRWASCSWRWAPGPGWPASSTCSPTASSRACCSSARAR